MTVAWLALWYIAIKASGKMAEMLIISQLTINFISYLHGAEKKNE